MILKALYDYYNRCEGLSAKGLEQKEIGYLIVIDKDGTFVRIESRMKDKKTAQTFLVLQTIKRSGRKYAPNILWDNYEYVIGGADESAKKHDTFIRMIEKLKEQVSSDRYLNAISEFYKKNEKLEDIIKMMCCMRKCINPRKTYHSCCKEKVRLLQKMKRSGI